MKKDINKILLTPQELQIMKVVWEMGAATVKDVFHVILKRKKIAYTTILTIMGILESKGALIHSKTGRAFIFRPLLSRQQAVRNQIHDVVDRFFDGDPQKLVENIHESGMVELSRKERTLQQNSEVLL